MTGSARSDSSKKRLIRRQSVSVASEWSQPYPARGAAYLTPLPDHVGQRRADPLQPHRVPGHPAHVQGAHGRVRLRNSSGRMVSAGGSATSTYTWPARIWTG
jgi:hypothetical protein